MIIKFCIAFQNYATCSFYACNGTVTLDVCSLYSGDTFFYLANDIGTVVEISDNVCTSGSTIVYNITSCGTYELREGCYGATSCSGTTYVSSTSTLTYTGSTAGSSTTTSNIISTYAGTGSTCKSFPSFPFPSFHLITDIFRSTFYKRSTNICYY